LTYGVPLLTADVYSDSGYTTNVGSEPFAASGNSLALTGLTPSHTYHVKMANGSSFNHAKVSFTLTATGN
jgi:hypothetical protein